MLLCSLAVSLALVRLAVQAEAQDRELEGRCTFVRVRRDLDIVCEFAWLCSHCSALLFFNSVSTMSAFVLLCTFVGIIERLSFLLSYTLLLHVERLTLRVCVQRLRMLIKLTFNCSSLLCCCSFKRSCFNCFWLGCRKLVAYSRWTVLIERFPLV